MELVSNWGKVHVIHNARMVVGIYNLQQYCGMKPQNNVSHGKILMSKEGQ